MKKNLLIYFCVSFFLFSSCSKNNNSNNTTVSSQVPYVSVNTSLNINTTGYTALQTAGGSVYLANVGYRGILLYRLNSSTILAFDRTCTYDISDANGIVYAQNTGDASCLDCGSSYSMSSGSVVQGPSTIGLQSYPVTFNTGSGAVTIKN